MDSDNTRVYLRRQRKRVSELEVAAGISGVGVHRDVEAAHFAAQTLQSSKI